MSGLTHLDAEGRARMVDVSAKESTARTATARGTVTMRPETLALDPVRRRAQGRCARRRPHRRHHGGQAHIRVDPALPSACAVVGFGRTDPDVARHAIDITVTCKLTGQTGVEMEALTQFPSPRYRLRHVQGGRSRHAHWRHPPDAEIGGKSGAFEAA